MSQPKSNEEIIDLVKSYARQYYLTAEENDSEENLKKKEEEIRQALAQKDAEVAETREQMVGHGYRMAVKHLKEAYSHNGATTVPEAIEWLEDNVRLFPTPKE